MILLKADSLISQRLDHVPCRVGNGDLQGNTTVQVVCGAAQSRVVGAYGHLHLVQDALVILAFLDELFGGLIHRQV